MMPRTEQLVHHHADLHRSGRWPRGSRGIEIDPGGAMSDWSK